MHFPPQLVSWLTPPPITKSTVSSVQVNAPDLPKVGKWVVRWRGSCNNTLHSWPVNVGRDTPSEGRNSRERSGFLISSYPSIPDQEPGYSISPVAPSLALHKPITAGPLRSFQEVPSTLKAWFLLPGVWRGSDTAFEDPACPHLP